MARILVYSDSGEKTRGLSRILRRDGHRTESASSESAAISRLAGGGAPEVIVLALTDPADALRRLSRGVAGGLRRTPAVAVVPEQEPQDGIDREVPGLLDLMPTPFTEESFLARIDALIRVRDVLNGAGPGSRFGARVGRDATSSEDSSALRRMLVRLDRWLHAPVRTRKRPLEPYLETAASIVGAVENRDSLDPGHSIRVANHCATIAAHIGLDPEQTQLLTYAAAVHDIGKITISAELLAKPALTEADRKMMRLHPRRGAELIRALTPYEGAAELVLQHHERPDGKGYYGKSGDQIPLAARILTVAEVFDAMTSSRAGRPPLAPEQAIANLREGSGTMYDKECVEALAASVRPRRASVPLSAIPPLPTH